MSGDEDLAGALLAAAGRAGAAAADVLVVSATGNAVGVRGGKLEEEPVAAMLGTFFLGFAA